MVISPPKIEKPDSQSGFMGTGLCSKYSMGVCSMRSLWLESVENTPLRNDEKDWVRAEIRSAVDALSPHGWRKAVVVLRELGPLAASISLVIALLGITAGAIYYSVENVKEETAFRTHTSDRLDQIEATLKLIPAQIAAAKYSSVPLQELKKHRDELKEIKDKLVTASRSTPGFWPTSFQVITLLSRATSPVEAKHALVDLTDVHGSGGELIKYPPGSVLKLHKVIENITFSDAIVYLEPNVILRDVTFINCTLILPELQIPPKPLEEIGNQLLSASDLSHLTLTVT